MSEYSSAGRSAFRPFEPLLLHPVSWLPCRPSRFLACPYGLESIGPRLLSCLSGSPGFVVRFPGRRHLAYFLVWLRTGSRPGCPCSLPRYKSASAYFLAALWIPSPLGPKVSSPGRGGKLVTLHATLTLANSSFLARQYGVQDKCIPWYTAQFLGADPSVLVRRSRELCSCAQKSHAVIALR